MKVLCTGGSGFIGTHLIDDFLAANVEFINIDIAPPKKQSHFPYWQECNILDVEKIGKIFDTYQPTHVVHLAARATMEGKSIEDFRDNTAGTANILGAVKNLSSTTRLIVTSSQHVRKPGSGLPKDDLDFNPHGLYGESKVITEELTQEADLACCWTIIRPTTVWGPYHPVLPTGLWKWMRKRLYLHPLNDPVVRGYGYVKNVVWQIQELLAAPENDVNRKVFYVGEASIKQIEWINAFSNALTGHGVFQVPKGFIHVLAIAGDVMGRAGLRFPMDSPRFFNLTTTNPVPMDPILALFGTPPYSSYQAVTETVQWLRENGFA
jgi:nucleoside-diphosphate-sugar epimerase